jgi:hypothetical protein
MFSKPPNGLVQNSGRAAQKRGAASNRERAVDRAADLAPTIAQIRATGATTLAAIAEGLNAAAIPTPRGQGKWSPVQVRRTLQALAEGTFVKKRADACELSDSPSGRSSSVVSTDTIFTRDRRIAVSAASVNCSMSVL